MPKEITHWAIATTASKNVNYKRIKCVIDENYTSFLAGAVAYDIPYYSRGKSSSILVKKADELHGVKTCNVWEPIINLLQNYSVDEDGDIPNVILSFILGCISHVIIDSLYHPLIYYFTGNYYDKDINKRNKAVFEHRQFESQLDLYYLRKLNYTGPTSAKYIFSQLQGPMIAEFLSLLYFSNDVDKRIEMTQDCLNTYIKTQGLLNNKIVKYTLKLVGIVNVEMRKRSALFYPKTIDPVYYRLFENNSQYRYPTSGELIQASLDTIYNKCLADIVLSFSKLGCCRTPNECIETIRSFSAVSLETGKECTNPSLMRYFLNNSA